MSYHSYPFAHVFEETNPVPVTHSTNPFRSGSSNRINDPPTFDGDPSKIANFIGHIKMSIYFDGSRFQDEISKIIFLCSFLTGFAFTWALPYIENLGTHNLDICMSSFELFLEEFQRSFGEVNEKLNNETQLLRLRQGRGSAAEYAANFRRLSARSGFNEAALLCMFREGLSEDLKDQLATRDLPNQLSTYTMKVIELDNRIRDCESRRRPFNRSSHTFAPRPKYVQPENQPVVRTTQVDTHTLRKFSPLSDQEKDRRRKLGLCLYCGGEGHTAVSCPRKGKASTQSL